MGGLATSLLSGSACKKPGPPEPLIKPGQFPGTPEGLTALWTEILNACLKDDRQRVHDLMVPFIMTPAELTTLLGAERAQAMGPRYEAMLGSLVNMGAIELVAHVYEKKYDDIAVTRIDTLPAAELSDPDRNVLGALVTKVPMYTVRVKKKTEAKGLRYDFFVYLNGMWRTGNLLGKYLPAVPAPPKPAEAAPDGGAPAEKSETSEPPAAAKAAGKAEAKPDAKAEAKPDAKSPDPAKVEQKTR